MALCENRELKNCSVIEVRSVSENCKNGFVNKQGVKQGGEKLAEVEERIFVGDCADGCMYKQTYHFVENSAHFVSKIELLSTNFKREATLKD